MALHTMKSLFRLNLVAFFVFAFSSCNRFSPVTGSVFIVTRGGENVKLGLVKIDVIPAQLIGDYLKDSQSKKADSPEDVFAGLPPGIQSAVTDADGKFTVELPTKAFFLAARGSRAIGDKTEEYFWLQYIPTARKEVEPVLLSNNNMLTESSLLILRVEAAAGDFR